MYPTRNRAQVFTGKKSLLVSCSPINQNETVQKKSHLIYLFIFNKMKEQAFLVTRQKKITSSLVIL